MRIHILYRFVEGPWGGGNQFLKAIREYFRKTGVYSKTPHDAEVILSNSHHCLWDVLKIKRKCPDKILIHRVDGPVSHVRGRDTAIDKIIFQFNNLVADGTIFQSNWSRNNNYEIGMRKAPYETTVMNAPDPSIFNPEGKKPFDPQKIKLVGSSWSGNVRRGFQIYQYLDEHLDFNKYEMTFVGNSPVEFKNIRWIKPVPSRELAKMLKEHDIYITASRKDPCSNALIEALHCGLPAVARNDGGHPEIVGEAGELFRDKRAVIGAINKVVQNYDYYQQQINLPTLDEVGQRYYQLAQTIYENHSSGHYCTKEASLSGVIGIGIGTLRWKALSKLKV